VPVTLQSAPAGVEVTVYLVIAEPPLLAGAVQLTVSELVVAFAAGVSGRALTTLVGALGATATGVPGLLAEVGELPTALVATKVMEYTVALVRPVITQLRAVVEQLKPPGDTDTT
jgi:hypothetical protein